MLDPSWIEIDRTNFELISYTFTEYFLCFFFNLLSEIIENWIRVQRNKHFWGHWRGIDPRKLPRLHFGVIFKFYGKVCG